MDVFLRDKIMRLADKQKEYLSEKEMETIKQHVKRKVSELSMQKKQNDKKVKEPEFFVSKFLH